MTSGARREIDLAPSPCFQVPCLQPRSKVLDVLLRHRLLRQPGGFEGFVSVGVFGDSTDPPLADGDHAEYLLRDRTAAALAANRHPHYRHDIVVSSVDHLIDLRAPIVDCFEAVIDGTRPLLAA